LLFELNLHFNQNIAAATFGPISFWFGVSGEIFTRSKTPYIDIKCEEQFERSPTHNPTKQNEDRFDGSK